MIYALLLLLTSSDEPARLTSDGLDKIRPLWSVDGRFLLYSRALPDGSSYIQLVRGSGAGGEEPEERRLTDRKETEYHGALSPDGRQVVLTVIPRSGTQGNCELASVGFDGSDLKVIQGDRDGKLSHQEWPAWSPDGKRLAFVSTHDGNQEIYTSAVDGSEVVRVTQSPGIDTHPCWTPDGTRLVFASDRFGGLEIVSTRTDGTDLVRLTKSSGVDDFPAVSPDGSRIAFSSNRDGQFEIYVMRVDGSGAANLTRWPGRDTMPAWHPDGRRLCFVSDRQGETDLYMMTVP